MVQTCIVLWISVYISQICVIDLYSKVHLYKYRICGSFESQLECLYCQIIVNNKRYLVIILFYFFVKFSLGVFLNEIKSYFDVVISFRDYYVRRYVDTGVTCTFMIHTCHLYVPTSTYTCKATCSLPLKLSLGKAQLSKAARLVV